MVIQRWQNLLLLLAVVLMCIFCSTPFALNNVAEATDSVSPVFVKDMPVLLVLNIVIAVLLVIGIFNFKNLRRQMTITIISVVLMCTSVVTCGFILYATMPNAEIIWTGGVLLLILALVFAIIAYRFMKKDHKLLRSYDRLR